MRKTTSERFWSKVLKTDTCWIWCGRIDDKGYGHFGETAKKKFLAHRWAWMEQHGYLKSSIPLLHECDVSYCVRPDHLKPGTQSQNMQDCVTRGRHRNQWTKDDWKVWAVKHFHPMLI